MMKYLKLIGKIFAILFTLTAVGIGGLMWRLNRAPLDLQFLLPYWKPKNGALTIEKIQLEQNKIYKLPRITIENIIYQIPDISFTALSIKGKWNMWNLLRGNVSLSSLTLVKPHIVIRLKDNNDPKTPWQDQVKIVQNLPVSELKVIEGVLTIIPADPHLPSISIFHLNAYMEKLWRLTNFNVIGTLLDQVPFKVSATLHHRSIKGNISIEVNGLTKEYLHPYIKSVASYVGFLEDKPWHLHLIGQVSKALFSDIHWDGKLKMHSLDKGEEQYEVIANNTKKTIEVLLKLPSLNISQLGIYWPETVATGARNWILKNVKEGTVPSTAIKFILGTTDFKLERIEGKTSVENGLVHVYDKVPDLKVTTANIKFNQKGTHISDIYGILEDINVEKGSFQMETDKPMVIRGHVKGNLKNFLRVAQNFDLPLPLLIPSIKGTAEFNAHVSIAPLDQKEEGRTPPKNQKDLAPSPSFADRLTIDVDGFIQKAGGIFVYKDQHFIFEHGDLGIFFNNEKFALKGQALLEQKPLQINILKVRPLQKTSPLTYDIRGQLHSKLLRSFLPESMQNMVKDGVIAFDVTAAPHGDMDEIHDETEAPEIMTTLHANLKMIGLDVKPIGWKKAKNVNGSLTIKMLSKNGHYSFPVIEIFTPDFSVIGDFIWDGKTVKDVNITLKYLQKEILKIVTRYQGAKTNFTVNGKNIDLRPFIQFLTDDTDNKEEKTEEKTTEEAPASSDASSEPHDYQIKINLQDVRLEENITIPSFQGDINLEKGNCTHALVTAKTNTGGALDFSIKPQDNKLILKGEGIKFDDFMKGFRFDRKISLESFDLKASKPLRQLDQPFQGSINIGKLHVFKVPLIGRLLSLISLENLVSQLTGGGLLFIMAEADFKYLNKQLTILRSVITSSGIGLSFEGDLDFNKKTLDITGAALPLNALNKFITHIPLLGTLLTGGDKDKGVFSSTFKVTGPFKDPKVTSNPLGVVVPTFMKKMFGMGKKSKNGASGIK